MFKTARQRLVGWNVLVLTLILIFLGAAVYGFYRSNVYRQVDKELRGQQFRIERYLLVSNTYPADLFTSPTSPLDPDYRVIITDGHGVPVSSSECPGTPFTTCPQQDALDPTSKAGVRQALLAGTDIRTSTFRGQPQRVLTFAAPLQLPYFIQISRSVNPEQTSLSEIGRLLILGGLGGVILSGFGSFFLANRAFVPIRHAFTRQRKFTADASHELRTPLALIRANAEMICRHSEQLPPGDTELVSEIIRETDHLNRMVSDLLTLARADSDSAEIHTKPVDLRALVADVHEDLQRIAESRGIGTEITFNGPVVVDGDEVRLRQLVLILLDNALKYTDTGGNVAMALVREDGRARLVVADTGVGIEPEDLPRIFDRFYRADQAREHESGGTGLGLAIAQWIVQAHHGSIKVDSQPGRGTKFLIELPARHDKATLS
jgi:two-component system, OmpR family, sensor histidine kinase CiaH